MIEALSEIHVKLEAFIKKFYKNQLIRGSLIFLLLALVFYVVIVFSEFLGHFSILTRTVLFYFAIAFLSVVLVYLVVKPILAYYKIGKTIDRFQANALLQEHFPELKDQLKNLLELEQMQGSVYSIDLIESAIKQKSETISPIPFVKAIKLRANSKYIKIIGVPSLIILALYFFSPNVLSEGTDRMLNYHQYYEKPSAFKFIIENDSLSVRRGENLILTVHTEGEYVPYPIYVEYGGVSYLLQKNEDNLFSYEFKNVNQNFKFYLTAEDYQSKVFDLIALPSPKIINFNISVKAPQYTGIPEQILKNNGDFICPEGSVVEWRFKTKDIDHLWMTWPDTTIDLENKLTNTFNYKKTLFTENAYAIGIQNAMFKEDQILKFLAQVIPDEYPGVWIESVLDSLNPTVFYFKGQASDDYGIRNIDFCYELAESELVKRVRVPIENREALQDFFYAFDFKEVAEQGENINYYFEVWDNDGINGSKKSRSKMFQFYLPTSKELDKMEDEKSKSLKDKLEESQELAKSLQEDVKQLKRDLVEKDANSFQINKKLSQIAEKQDRLEQLMEEVAKENEQTNELLKNLNKEDQALLEKQKMIEDLINELMDEEMKKLLEEINKLMDEFDKDEFNDLTEEMEMSYEDLEEQLDRNLEQLKRLDVEKKMLQSIDELKKLAEEHQKLSEETKVSEENAEELKKKQKEQQEKMADIAEKVKESLKKNADLKEPMNLADFNKAMEEIKEGMQKSSESLNGGKNKKASKQQQGSAEQMKEVAQQMQQMLEEAMEEQQEQDMASLRQIIENLTTFSFEQEEVMLDFRGLRYKNPKYIQLFNQQVKAGENFQLIKDSLYALAMTQPMIAAPINKELIEIERELSKTESSLDDRKSGKAQSSQQLVMTSANNLALLLSDILEQMQMQQQQAKKEKSGNCDKPGSGNPKPGFGKAKENAQSMKQQMQNMLDQLKDGKDGKGGKSGKNGQKKTNKELGKMIAEQEKMQKMLSDLANSQGISPEAAQKLKEIKNISEQIESDLIQKNVTPATLKRQELILTRLLEAENSEFKREQENKRESNAVKYQKISNPEKYFKYKDSDLIGNDILLKKKIKLKQFYKEKYKTYIQNINE